MGLREDVENILWRLVNFLPLNLDLSRGDHEEDATKEIEICLNKILSLLSHQPKLEAIEYHELDKLLHKALAPFTPTKVINKLRDSIIVTYGQDKGEEVGEDNLMNFIVDVEEDHKVMSNPLYEALAKALLSNYKIIKR